MIISNKMKRCIAFMLLFIMLFTQFSSMNVSAIKTIDLFSQSENMINLDDSVLSVATDSNVTIATDSNGTIATNSNAVAFFQQVIETENIQDWEKYPEYWTDGSDKEYSLFLSDRELLDSNAGIATVRSAKLLYLAKDNEASRNQDYDIYIAGIDYQVASINTFYNGIKFSRFIVKDIDGELKISEREEVFMEQIKTVDMIDEVLFNLLTKEQMFRAINTAYKVRVARTEGFIVDGDMTVHDQLYSTDEEFQIPPDYTARIGKKCTTHNKPENVKVYRTATGKIDTVPFWEYAMVVLGSETIVSNSKNEEYLKASLILIQQYATFYMTYGGKHEGKPYNLKDDESDQAYKPERYHNISQMYKDKIHAAYDAVQHIHLEIDGDAFLPHYCQDSTVDKYKDTYYSIYQKDMYNDSVAGKTYQEILSRFNGKKLDYGNAYGVSSKKISFHNYNGWRLVGGKWYYYDTVGNKVTGWRQISGSWYYFNPPGGAMATGWTLDYSNGKYYYLHSSGVMHTGWLELNGKWYYLQPLGHRIENDWFMDQNKWYYFGTGGVMHTGWLEYKNNWYYLQPQGHMVTHDWIEDPKGSNRWYWLKGDGIMARGETIMYNGKLYQFNSSGLCMNP